MRHDARTILLDAIASGERIELWTRTMSRVTELREVVDFRNLLSHGYESVDQRVVWSLAQHELPALVLELKRLAAELS